MTIEHNLIVGLEDIKGIQIECISCKARVTRSPDKPSYGIPQQCGACGASWPQEFGREPAEAQLLRLIASLRTAKNGAFKLCLEFDGKVMA
jgi:hypothetical protein